MNVEKYILNLLKIRPRSRQELTEKLLDKGVSSEQSDVILDKYQKKGIFSDDIFCRWWIEQRLSTYRSKALIEHELLQKGIEQELIDAYFEKMKVDDRKTIKDFIESYAVKNSAEYTEKEKVKIFRKLIGKGFAQEDISEFFEVREI